MIVVLLCTPFYEFVKSLVPNNLSHKIHQMKQVQNKFLLAIAFIVVCIELLWIKLGEITHHLVQYAKLQKVEQFIKTLSPYQSLVVFLVSFFLIEPVKLFCYWYITQSFMIGVMMLIIAKIVGAALFAYTYRITENQIAKIDWFNNWVLQPIKSKFNKAKQYINDHEQVIKAKEIILDMRASIATAKLGFISRQKYKIKAYAKFVKKVFQK